MARLRAACTGTACFLTLAFLLGACGGKDGATTASGPSSSVPDTTSTTAEPATTTTTAAVTTTTRRPTATTASAAPSGPAAAAPTGPAAVKPPAAGTYRYSTSGATTFGLSNVPFPAITTLVVDPAAGTRQRSTRDLRDAAGVGPVTEFTLDYRADGVYLESLRLTTTAGGFTDTRELRPPAPTLFLPAGARPGTSLAIDLPTATGVAKVTVDVQAEERVVVGGQGVDTLKVRMIATLPPGDVTGRQELTLNVDTASGLWVRERSVTEASASGGLLQLHSSYDATLQRLTPG
ncbi:MAG: hypothetical protein QOJ69_867 [Actinomycetota bacterium]|nr:hypothetical protein [Actinomycetota bacterium]